MHNGIHAFVESGYHQNVRGMHEHDSICKLNYYTNKCLSVPLLHCKLDLCLYLWLMFHMQLARTARYASTPSVFMDLLK